MRNSKGFTLIELLVVIAIIGILAAVVTTSLAQARKKTRDARIVQDLTSVRTALELYATDNGGRYPAIGGGGTGSWYTACKGDTNSIIPGLTPNYIASLPYTKETGPVNKCHYYTSNGTDYKYMVLNALESVACPPVPLSFGFLDPVRSASQCIIGLYSSGAVSW